MQLPKWAGCCLGGLIGVVPMMGISLLQGDRVHCAEPRHSLEVVQSMGSDCVGVPFSTENPPTLSSEFLEN